MNTKQQNISKSETMLMLTMFTSLIKEEISNSPSVQINGFDKDSDEYFYLCAYYDAADSLTRLNFSQSKIFDLIGSEYINALEKFQNNKTKAKEKEITRTLLIIKDEMKNTAEIDKNRPK